MIFFIVVELLQDEHVIVQLVDHAEFRTKLHKNRGNLVIYICKKKRQISLLLSQQHYEF